MSINLPPSMHFIGIAGIGMSGVAQAAASLGVRVSGSDRALLAPENARILDALRKQKITLFPQDGSVYSDRVPDALVYSSAIEEGNPDYRAGIEKLHRSEAVVRIVNAMQGKKLHAVAGTCGKTTVSAWLTEALARLHADPVSLCGGLMNAFTSEQFCGNFKTGQGDAFVLEADESDKSLLNYSPDSAILLNIGADHFDLKTVAEVFSQFLDRVSGPCVVEDNAFRKLSPDRLKGKHILLVSADPDAPESIDGFPVRKLSAFRIADGRFLCSFNDLPEFTLPVPGVHSALNALAVHTLLCAIGFDPLPALHAVEKFSGVWRRFDFAGHRKSGAAVYDDYAHNPDKLRSALKTAQSVAREHVHTIFQPHGFKPMRMMRGDLFDMLEKELRPGDTFSFLPVFYAGGTTTFEPKSEDVVSGYRAGSLHGERYHCFGNREDAEKFLKSVETGDDLVLIAGARDNSLSIWAKKIAFFA